MDQRKSAIDGRSKPESILIEGSDITDSQSKKPGSSSNPTVEKERISDKHSRKSDSKGKKTDIVVNDSKEDNRVQNGLLGFFLMLFGFFGIINTGDEACCFFLIIIVIGFSLLIQSISSTTEKNVGFLESLGSVLLILFILSIIGFFILLNALSQF